MSEQGLQIFLLNHSVYEIGAEIENLNNIKLELGKIATDAINKLDTQSEEYFLFDNNSTLQISTNYLHQVLDEINKKHEEIERMANSLFNESRK